MQGQEKAREDNFMKKDTGLKEGKNILLTAKAWFINVLVQERRSKIMEILFLTKTY